MTVQYIVVGYRAGLLTELDAVLPPASVQVLEEPALIESRGLAQQATSLPCVAALVGAPIQQEGRLDEVIALAAADPTVLAVIPGGEYVVVAAAAIADALGLPGAGLSAASALRDKGRLRQALSGVDVRQPDWREVRTAGDVARFRADHGGRCVLKPANRQSSLGVQLLGPQDDLERAWELTTSADEPQQQRTPEWSPDRYLVEELLVGPEVSVEAVVHAGEVGFVNVTAKRVLEGRHPVEIGHVVPAALAPHTRSALEASIRAVAAGTGFSFGMLHAEWILVDGTEPYLVECGGRLPGDDIVTLIDLAHGGSLVADWMAVLRGQSPSTRVADPVRGAAVRFFEAGPGVVTAISGEQDARNLNGVHTVLVQTAVGELLRPVESSWDRPGRVVVAAEDGPAAEQLADKAAAMVRIEVAPNP